MDLWVLLVSSFLAATILPFASEVPPAVVSCSLPLTITNNYGQTSDHHGAGKKLRNRERAHDRGIHSNRLDGESQRAGENKVTRKHGGI